jgi:hypothetical protein
LLQVENLGEISKGVSGVDKVPLYVGVYARTGVGYLRHHYEAVRHQPCSQVVVEYRFSNWPLAARLDLLVLLCEMLAASNTGAPDTAQVCTYTQVRLTASCCYVLQINGVSAL